MLERQVFMMTQLLIKRATVRKTSMSHSVTYSSCSTFCTVGLIPIYMQCVYYVAMASGF